MTCKRCNNDNVHGNHYCRECETDLNLYGRYKPNLCIECQLTKRDGRSYYCKDCRNKEIMTRIKRK